MPWQSLISQSALKCLLHCAYSVEAHHANLAAFAESPRCYLHQSNVAMVMLTHLEVLAHKCCEKAEHLCTHVLTLYHGLLFH